MKSDKYLIMLNAWVFITVSACAGGMAQQQPQAQTFDQNSSSNQSVTAANGSVQPAQSKTTPGDTSSAATPKAEQGSLMPLPPIKETVTTITGTSTSCPMPQPSSKTTETFDPATTPHLVIDYTDAEGNERKIEFRGDLVVPKVVKGEVTINASYRSPSVYHKLQEEMKIKLTAEQVFTVQGFRHEEHNLPNLDYRALQDNIVNDLTFDGTNASCEYRLEKDDDTDGLFLTFECKGKEFDFEGESFIPAKYIWNSPPTK